MVRALILRGDLFQRLFILLELFRQRADLSTQLFIFLGQFYAVLKMRRRLGFRRFLLFRRFLEHFEHLLLRDLFNVDLLHRSALHDHPVVGQHIRLRGEPAKLHAARTNKGQRIVSDGVVIHIDVEPSLR